MSRISEMIEKYSESRTLNAHKSIIFAKNRMVKYIDKGDIFRIPGVKNYAHGCNCAGAMGKGIAVQFRKMYPEMYLQYKKLCLEGVFLPGDVFVYKYNEGFVFNLGTQLTWRTKATLENIRESLTKMMAIAEEKGIESIAMPRIGAGLGGLPWQDVKAVIEDVAGQHQQTTLFVVENFVSFL